MEYYAGYLMPVQFDESNTHKPCREAGKLKKRIKSELGVLEARIKSIEGRMIQQPTESRTRPRRESHESRSLNKMKYKVIENEYRDYNLKAENEKLREENRLLNEYFEIFSKKYRDNKQQLTTLREENARLNAILSRNTFESTPPAQVRSFHQRSTSKFEERNLDKYVYDTPPYEQDQASGKEESLTAPRLNLIKGSGIQTKITGTHYEDSCTDFARTSRSNRNNTVQSGLI